jgi:8-amino-3,8-dideoxy-alpha-D-manno-octulosonate transaminase
MKSMAGLPFHLQKACPDYSRVHLPQSDRIMSRTLSLQIKLSWTPEMLQKRVEIIEKVMKMV